jgi:hypothetical protein
MLAKTESQMKGHQNRGISDKIKFYINAGQNSYYLYFVKKDKPLYIFTKQE